MLMPKRVKFRKPHAKSAIKGKTKRGARIAFGEYALKAMEPKRITARQIEAARVAMTRFIKKGGKVWIRIFPDLAITAKPAETRMGKGKGAPETWVAPVRPGRILFELEGLPLDQAKRAMKLAADKLPITTKFISREEEALI